MFRLFLKRCTNGLDSSIVSKENLKISFDIKNAVISYTLKLFKKSVFCCSISCEGIVLQFIQEMTPLVQYDYIRLVAYASLDLEIVGRFSSLHLKTLLKPSLGAKCSG
jgi:hypothetical protein